MRGLPLDVRNGAWVHVRDGDDPDDRSAEQQTRDRLLRDLALAIHYDRVMPAQGEHVARRSRNAGPHAAKIDADPGQSPAPTTECRRDNLLVSRATSLETRPGASWRRSSSASRCAGHADLGISTRQRTHDFMD